MSTKSKIAVTQGKHREFENEIWVGTLVDGDQGSGVLGLKTFINS